MERMRQALLLCCVLLVGCDPVGAGVLLGVNAAAVVGIQRTVPDLAVSIISGRNCSIVHVDHDTPYCSPIEPVATPPPPCTRSLGGGADCWAIAAVPPGHLVADQRPPTGAQETDRGRGWFRRWIGL